MTTQIGNLPAVVSREEWLAARKELLTKEKELTRARDALAAQRRRMPWTPVPNRYAFDGPDGRANLLDLFDGRRQLIVYRAFMDPGVEGWPEHGCSGCSLMADHVGDLSHLNARDTTLVYASRGSQQDITRIKDRMGWTIPWYTIVEESGVAFDADFRRRRMARDECLHPRGRPDLPHLLRQQPRRRGIRNHLELSGHHGARPSGIVGGLPRRLPADSAL